MKERKAYIFVFSVVGLGYHDDLQTRAVFMEVLTKILQQVGKGFGIWQKVHCQTKPPKTESFISIFISFFF